MKWTEHPSYREHRAVITAAFTFLRASKPEGIKAPVLIAIEQDDGKFTLDLTSYEEAVRTFKELDTQSYLQALERGKAKADEAAIRSPVVILAVNRAGDVAVTCVGDRLPNLNAKGGSA